MPGYGQGRLSVLDCPMSLHRCIEMTKSHLQLSNVRLARAVGQHLRKFDSSSCVLSTVVVCSLVSCDYNGKSHSTMLLQPSQC